MSSIHVDDQVVPAGPLPSGAVNGDDRQDVSRLARSEEGRKVALMAVGELVSDFIGRGGKQTQDNVARILSEVAEQLPDSVVAEATTGYIEQTREAPVAVDDYEIPADVQALLDEPEEEPDEEEEELPAAAEVEPEVEDTYDPSQEYVDPEVRALQQKLQKAEKKAEHERSLRVKASVKDWRGEAQRVFRLGPLELLSTEELDAIKADSRKDFLRQAKAVADRNRGIAERFGATGQPAPAADTRKQEWGVPPAGAPSVQPESHAQQDRLARARRTGNLSQLIKARIFEES